MANRKFGPKTAGSPSIGEKCIACHVPFVEGDFTTLVAIGPGDDPEEQAKSKAHLPYNAVAVEVHFDCAGESTN